MLKRRTPRARATVICYRSGKILLVRRKASKWNFPGGRIEAGEAPAQAAARELAEETGICRDGLLALCTLDVDGLVHHIFTTQLHDLDKPVPGSEIVACKWVRREQLGKTLLKATAAALMAKALPALSA